VNDNIDESVFGRKDELWFKFLLKIILFYKFINS
jgi:hypothetical protein